MSLNNDDIFEFSPSTTGNRLFRVPVYQRLYAWGREQIWQLLDDITAAFEKDHTSDYYIGSIVLSRSKDDTFILIDGQQRLTTLF
jgi:uncharacterized protein with ParB-like and HNH nuclease domain